MKFQIPKGLFDILPYGTDMPWKTSDLWHFAEVVIRKLALDYNFQEIRTPIFEKAELFQRTVGETTDIIAKEMYTFEDRAGRLLSLRPEGTASVMRSFIENSLHQLKPVHKLYYIGPMFRYERPQAGRYRQHHQFGVEAIGLDSPEQDVEVIDMLCELYHRLGISDTTLYLNTLGDHSSKETYKKKFLSFLKPKYSELSKDSQRRFNTNPLRILDSKAPTDQKLLKDAPSILDCLSKESENHFNCVCRLLDSLKQPYVINHKLVRGLDYYSNTVFEVTSGVLGAQNSLGGGGRYDTLISDLGGPNLPGTGFATGIERILRTLVEQNIPTPSLSLCFFYFIPLGEKEREICLNLATALRHAKIPCNIDFKSKKLQKALSTASQQQAFFAIILGSEELKENQVQIKNLSSQKQYSISLTDFCDHGKTTWEEFQSQKLFKESYV